MAASDFIERFGGSIKPNIVDVTSCVKTRDVTSAILVSQYNETAAILVSLDPILWDLKLFRM